MAEFKVVEGWTSPLSFQLLLDGSAVDITLHSIELLLKDRFGRPVDTDGDVDKVTPTSGIVSYTPDPGDLVASRAPYRSRFKATDAAGRVTWFPSGEEWDVWRVGAT